MTAIQIAKLRVGLGLGVEEFAQKVGVSRMTVYRWTEGRSKPSGLALKALERLAKRAKK